MSCQLVSYFSEFEVMYMHVRSLVILTCCFGVDPSLAFAWQDLDTDTESTIAEAEKILVVRSRIADDLVRIVNDENYKFAERQKASQLLGRLQYGAAIDSLVRHVDLVDAAAIESVFRPDSRYPVAIALATYGDLAVPQIVNAYIVERSQERRTVLAWVLRKGKSIETAKRYLRGTPTPNEMDWLRRQNIRELERVLNQE